MKLRYVIAQAENGWLLEVYSMPNVEKVRVYVAPSHGELLSILSMELERADG